MGEEGSHISRQATVCKAIQTAISGIARARIGNPKGQRGRKGKDEPRGMDDKIAIEKSHQERKRKEKAKHEKSVVRSGAGCARPHVM